jgi:hypothetical protein
MGNKGKTAMIITTPRLRIVPYGTITEKLQTVVSEGRFRGASISTAERMRSVSSRRGASEFWIASSREINDAFNRRFRQSATPTARLLVLNESLSSDNLLAQIVQLPIRSPDRVCIVDLACGLGKTHVSIHSLLQRLASLARATEGNDGTTRILDATIEDDVLHVVSLNFQRLDVPLAKIESLAGDDLTALQEFEIDPDGSFIYWLRLDVHLGWAQLRQIVDPIAAHRAQQKSREFNTRYGKAVRKVREEAGLKLTDIEGISDKQLRRIESGNCRLTTNAIEALAKTHKLTPNEYLERLAGALE